uniref:Secreted protein n=1 Tax=Arundo donax TaxID=35708 RepID=A0A0A8ZV66_ARUDO
MRVLPCFFLPSWFQVPVGWLFAFRQNAWTGSLLFHSSTTSSLLGTWCGVSCFGKRQHFFGAFELVEARNSDF